MSLGFLDLDRAAALHLATALAAHRRRCRDDGIPLPEALDHLAEAAMRRAEGDSNRQEAPFLANLAN